MSMRATALAIAAVSATVPAMTAAQSPRSGLATTLRQMDAAFVCPQFLPNDEARRMELSTFARTLAAKGVSFAQANGIRANFLTRHNCLGPASPGPGAATPASSKSVAIAEATSP